MTDQSTLSTFATAVQTLQRAVTFRAWIQNREITGSAELATAQTFEEALAAIAPWASHKQNICLLRDDAGHREKVLCIYTVRQESKAQWRRDPVTGEPVATRRTYPEMVHTMAVEAFEPVRPFDALRDCAVGVDRTLVEMK